MSERVGPEREWGGGDCDQPYRFGRKPTADWPSPFTVRQFIKLWLLKLRVRPEGVVDELDRPEPAVVPGQARPGD